MERAERLRVEPARLQFLFARTCLRILLSRILNLEPKLIPLTLNAYGKPQTSGSVGHPLHFNLAHSRDTILIAVSRECPVGVDIEYLDRETDALEIARNFFHPSEFQEITAIEDVELRRKAFFRCWTRKEAIAKADGRGLSLPLTSFRVPVIGPAYGTRVIVPNLSEVACQSESKRTLEGEIATARTAEYFVTNIDIEDGIAAAFAASRPDLRLRSLVFTSATL